MAHEYAAISAEVRSGSVLIVEDDDDMRALLKSLLHTLLFHNSIGVARMDAAVDSLEYGVFSLAIVDLNLGDCDGVSLISDIRSHPRSCIASMPVLVASTASTSLRISAAVAAGADSFLCKPFSITNLKRQLQFACARSAIRQGKTAASHTSSFPNGPHRETLELD